LRLVWKIIFNIFPLDLDIQIWFINIFFGAKSRVSISILAKGNEKSMNAWLKSILTETCFRVKTANTPVEGIKAVRNDNPNIIILDLVSTGTEGLQLCRSIRCFDSASILVLSALNTLNLVAKVLDEGADDFLNKLEHHRVLIDHLKTLMGRIRCGQTPQFINDCYTCGRIERNPQYQNNSTFNWGICRLE